MKKLTNQEWHLRNDRNEIKFNCHLEKYPHFNKILKFTYNRLTCTKK